MAVRTPIEQTEGLYFITFTCCQWLPLFEITDGYDTVYKWFDYLKSKNHFLKGYVIMPNHLHVLIDFSASPKSINAIVSNGKRFMAYELVKRLQKSGNDEMLKKLMQAVAASDKDRGKKHQVFERSFDCKLITTNHFFLEKLNYIHSNPCSGVWGLVENPVDYRYSSAKYYIGGMQSEYPIDSE
jgi:REP element-mobilizing transposase RayT